MRMKTEAGNIMSFCKSSKGRRGRRNFMVGLVEYLSLFSFLVLSVLISSYREMYIYIFHNM